MEVGTPMGLRPGHTSSIRRIEAAMMSYHADMTIENNPFELGLDRLVNLEIEADFVGKEALAKIKAEGVRQKLVGLEIAGAPLAGSNDAFWPVQGDDGKVGYVTSAIYSPRLQKNIALAMLGIDHTVPGTRLGVNRLGEIRDAEVVPIPFYDPKKALAVAG